MGVETFVRTKDVTIPNQLGLKQKAKVGSRKQAVAGGSTKRGSIRSAGAEGGR